MHTKKNKLDKECRKEDSLISRYLSDVKEQIKYVPAREKLCLELQEHMEDRIDEYMELGIEAKEAEAKAVANMGDASELGIKLNESYHLQLHFPLLCMISIGTIFGMGSNFVYGYDVFYNIYFLLGLIVLGITIEYGYSFIVKHTSLFFRGAFILGVVYTGSSLFRPVVYMLHINHFDYFGGMIQILYDLFDRVIYSITPFFNLLFFILPVYVVVIYKGRNKGIKGMIPAVFLVLGAAIVVSITPLKEYIILSVFITFLAIMIVTYLLIAYGYFNLGKVKIAGLMTGVFIAAIIVVGASYMSVIKSSLKMCFVPDKVAESRWDDAYNGVLVKELLSRSVLFGTADISPEELVEYGTGNWYFTHGEDKDFMKHFYEDESTVTVANVLPQHYLNNYRITYIIVTYGWVPGILFIAFLIGFCVLCVRITKGIASRLGFAVSSSCTIILSLQIIMYTAGDFGYQFGSFGNLPFISEGTCSIIVNMILIGLIVSVHRYDKVIVSK